MDPEPPFSEEYSPGPATDSSERPQATVQTSVEPSGEPTVAPAPTSAGPLGDVTSAEVASSTGTVAVDAGKPRRVTIRARIIP